MAGELPARADAIAAITLVSAFIVVVVAGPIYRLVGPRPTQSQCNTLLERLQEHEAFVQSSWQGSGKAVAPAPPDPESLARNQSQCLKALTADEATCAINAPYLDAFERCLP